MNGIGVEYLRSFSAWLWEASWQSTLLAVVVLGVQWILKKQLSAHWRNALWLLVLARLLLPTLPHARFSAYNWLPSGNRAARPAIPYLPRNSPPQVIARYPGAHLIFPREALPAKPRTPPTPGVTASPGPSNPLPLLPVLWMAGCLAISAHTLAAYLRLARKVRRLRADAPETLKNQFVDAKAELQVNRAELVVSEAVGTPFVTGFWKAKVILPMGLEEKLSPEDIRMVLLHELAHVKRGDLRITWLSWLAATLHWFNPCIRYALALARKDREMACDEWVLRFVSHAQAYGAALIRFTELNQAPMPAGFGAIGILESKSALVQRIERIAAYRRPTFLASVTGVAVLVGVGLFTLTNASDQKSPSPAIPRPKAAPSRAGIEADLAKLQKALRDLADVDHDTIWALAGNYMYSLDIRGKSPEEGNVRLVTPGYHFAIHDITADTNIYTQIEFKHYSPFLYSAIERGDPVLVRELLKDGAIPNRPKNDEAHLFEPDGTPVLTRSLPDDGPIPYLRNDKSPLFEPLEAAVDSLMRTPNDEKRKQIVQILLEYGADPNPKLANNRSLLFLPVANDMVELVKFLLDAGIDPRKDTDGGGALLEEAERHGSEEMKSLIKMELENEREKSTDPSNFKLARRGPKAELVLASASDRSATPPTAADLDADAAARLAASLANSEAKRQFGRAPFRPAQDTPTFSKGRWWWQAIAAYGKGDLRAVVSFTRTGSKPEVRLETLSSATENS